MERVAAGPQLGPDCGDIRDGYRRIGVGSHLIFYRHDAVALDVVRVLHQRMDNAARLK